jgi:hypothetical protein
MTDTPTDKPLSERFGGFDSAEQQERAVFMDAFDAADSKLFAKGVAAGIAALDKLRALRLAESHPSAIREAVEQEREAIAEIADEDAMNIRSQIRKVSESDVVNSIDAAAKWNRATALEDFAFCVRARTKDEANG